MRIDDEIGKVALPVPVMIYILFNTYLLIYLPTHLFCYLLSFAKLLSLIINLIFSWLHYIRISLYLKSKTTGH